MRSYIRRSGRVFRRERRVRLHLEALEDQTLLNAYIVNLTTDSRCSRGPIYSAFHSTNI